MAQLDKLLAAMVSNHASALVLADGDVVKVEIGGQMKPLTKAPLTSPQILAIIAECAGPAEKAALTAGQPVQIPRTTTDGSFVIHGTPSGGKWGLRVVSAPAAPAAAPSIAGLGGIEILPPVSGAIAAPEGITPLAGLQGHMGDMEPVPLPTPTAAAPPKRQSMVMKAMGAFVDMVTPAPAPLDRR